MDAQSLYNQVRLEAMHRRMDELGIPHEKRAGIIKMMPAAWKLGQGVMGKVKNVGSNILRRPGVVGGAESPLAVGAGALRKPFQAIANNPVKSTLAAGAGVAGASGAAGVGLGSAATQNHFVNKVLPEEASRIQSTLANMKDDEASPYNGMTGMLAKLFDILFNRQRFNQTMQGQFMRSLAQQGGYSGNWARSQLQQPAPRA